MKILLAGILGGIAMLIWTSIAHLVLPFGEAGTREIPSELAAQRLRCSDDFDADKSVQTLSEVLKLACIAEAYVDVDLHLSRSITGA